MSALREICRGGVGSCCADCRKWVVRLASSEPVTPDMKWIEPDPLDHGGCGRWQGDEPMRVEQGSRL